MTFKEFLQLEGGFLPDEKAEDGKSKVKNPPVRGPSSVQPTGVAGGAGNGKGMSISAVPAKSKKK